MGDVIPFERADTGYDGLTCECGEAWFDTAVVIGSDGLVAGYQLPLKCHACGKAIDHA